jgi:hypothetical protein
VAAPTEAEAQHLVSLLAPKVSAVEEIILVLNPLYNDRVQEASALLVRMQYLFVKTARKQLERAEAEQLLGDRDAESAMPQGSRLIEHFTCAEVHLFHVSKVAAAREARALFARGGVLLEEHLERRAEVADAVSPLLPDSMPHLFLLMGSDAMFEAGMQLLHGQEQASFTASDFLDDGLGYGPRHSGRDTQHILETCLCTTAGESMLRVVFDADGQLVPRQRLKERDPWPHCSRSAHLWPEQYDLGGADQPPDWREATQFELMLAAKAWGEQSLSFVAEGESHNLFEIRIHRLTQRGDWTAGGQLALGPQDEGSEDSVDGEEAKQDVKPAARHQSGTSKAGKW